MPEPNNRPLTTKELVLLGPYSLKMAALVNDVLTNPEYVALTKEVNDLGFEVTPIVLIGVDRLTQPDFKPKVVDNVIQPGTFKGKDAKFLKGMKIDLTK